MARTSAWTRVIFIRRPPDACPPEGPVVPARGRERAGVVPEGNGRSATALERRSPGSPGMVTSGVPRLPAMLLSDRDITGAIAEGRLGIEPYDAGLVQPSSIDVRLDRFFRVFNNARYTHIDPAQQQDDLTTLVEPDGDEPFVLHPGEFVLGSTLEVVSIPDDLAARLEGKSSLGRLGLLTHSTAGFVDPGFSGHITLELSNVANLPITLWPGMKIGQLCLFRLTSASEHPYGSAVYGSRYQDQRGPTPSRSYRNFTRAETRRPE
jgi:dCTP deaminase